MTHIIRISADITTPDALVGNSITYLVDASNGPVTVYLSDKMKAGMEFSIIKVDSSLHSVYVEPLGSNVILNEENLEIPLQFSAATIVACDPDWYLR